MAQQGYRCVAGPENVECDFCNGTKRKAFKSCLQCKFSYCQEHIQPHYEGPLKKHSLVEASKRHENICSQHNEEKNIFCRTDQQRICVSCFTTEHKGHSIVSVSKEVPEKQEELRKRQQEIHQRIQSQEKDVIALQQKMDALNRSADKAVEDSEKMSTELITLIQKRSSGVTRKIKLQQGIEVSWAEKLQEKLKLEIADLRKNKIDLEKLSAEDDPTQFLHKYALLTPLPKSTTVPIFNTGPLQYFEEVTASVSAARDTLQTSCTKEWTNISRCVAEVNVFPLPEPRAEFLQYAKCFKLDQNTASMKMSLSEGNRKATCTKDQQPYGAHADRFMGRSQALCKTGLSGRHYWEVEWSGLGVSVAVAYRDIARTGACSVFGENDRSWALEVLNQEHSITYNFKHNRNRKKKSFAKPCASKVGVFLDHKKGILSFYEVSDTITFLFREQTRFSQPLYAGLGVYYYGSTAKFCDTM
uniref:tripartite motif-containing protein 16-like n=1 Tax=Gasterosteus aculeatus aculeatus TaxID=481459 RepID=UPI001A983CD8|nr:tripartite motif-containing protein 16-like [Gasterosteus aculeatus aculeatus]